MEHLILPTFLVFSVALNGFLLYKLEFYIKENTNLRIDLLHRK